MGLKSIINVDGDKLRQLKVGGKFSYTFKRIYTFLCVALVLLVASIAIGIFSYSNLYKNYYNQNTYQGLLRIHNQNLAKSAWWALATRVDEDRQEHINEFHVTMMQNLKDDLTNLRAYRGETELIKALDADLASIENVTDKLADMYDEGTVLEDGTMSNADEIYEVMHEKLRPNVVKTIEDARQMTKNVSGEVEKSFELTMIIMVIFVVISIVMILLLVIFMKNAQKTLTTCVVSPVDEVARAAEQMARGDLNVSIRYQANDEFDVLARDLENSTHISMKIVDDISDSLDHIAGGDFSRGTITPDLYHGNFAPISHSIDTITDRLSDTMKDVKMSSERVSAGADDMSKGANELAEGATDQAAAVEELTASVNTVCDQTEQLAADSEKGVEMSAVAQRIASDGAEKMDHVTEAMERITSASREIQEIANSIEAISSQTKLLALNASIEAARAGDTGRGFAVVAEEISQLAQQSNEAVQKTYMLVNKALAEIDSGNVIVNETQITLHKIADSVNDLANMMRQSGEMASHQATSMREINLGIEQISEVIQSNTATAEESSAVSNVLSDQSNHLNDLVAQFRIKNI